MQCARHPRTETYVRCSKCDAPVCGECMVTGPVGVRCRSCAQLNSSPLFKPGPTGLLRAGIAGIITAVLFGWLVNLWFIPVPFILGGAALGCLIGEVVLRSGGRKRGRLMEWVAGLSAVLGVLLWRVPWLAIFTMGLGALLTFLLSPTGLLFTLIAAALAVACAVSRIRYL
jgi:hypothetical protein